MIGDFQCSLVEIRSKARAPGDTSLFFLVKYHPGQSDVKHYGAPVYKIERIIEGKNL